MGDGAILVLVLFMFSCKGVDSDGEASVYCTYM
jgi:hypothetical protein